MTDVGRRTFRILAILAIVGLAACDGLPPLVPSDLSLPTGPQWLTLTGFDLANDPTFPVCSDIGFPPDGKTLVARVTLERQGARYIGRSSSAEFGDLEFEIQGTGRTGPLGYPIVGSISGRALDAALPIRPAADVRIDIRGTGTASAADMDGTATIGPAATFLQGQIRGRITFSDSGNHDGACTTILWMMQAVPAALQD